MPSHQGRTEGGGGSSLSTSPSSPSPSAMAASMSSLAALESGFLRAARKASRCPGGRRWKSSLVSMSSVVNLSTVYAEAVRENERGRTYQGPRRRGHLLARHRPRPRKYRRPLRTSAAFPSSSASPPYPLQSPGLSRRVPPLCRRVRSIERATGCQLRSS